MKLCIFAVSFLEELPVYASGVDGCKEEEEELGVAQRLVPEASDLTFIVLTYQAVSPCGQIVLSIISNLLPGIKPENSSKEINRIFLITSGKGTGIDANHIHAHGLARLD